VAIFFIGLASLAGDAVPAALVNGAAAAALLGAGGLIALMAAPHRLLAIVQRVGGRAAAAQWPLAATLADWTAEFCATWQPLRSRHVVVPIVLLSVVAWVLEGGIFAAVVIGLGLTVATPVAPWFAMAAGTLGTLIPGTPGYVGTFDYFTMVGLTAFGVPADGAIVAAFLIHLVLWGPVTLAGALWLAALKGARGWRPALKAAEASS
jgi:uncharacterized membrane protein YbhN (UPF0104 family)